MSPSDETGAHRRIPVEHGELEALMDEASSPRAAAVLCHPHPQHGGTMHTRALYHAARALNEVGVSTLRFNFRGVGSSTGSFDGGEGERGDVRAALDYLDQRRDGGTLLLGGFSFGAMVGLPVGNSDERVRGLLGMGLPLSLQSFDWLTGVEVKTLLLQGSEDQFGSAEELRDLAEANPDRVTLRVLRGADHLFTGHEEQLRDGIREYYTNGPGASLLI